MLIIYIHWSPHPHTLRLVKTRMYTLAHALFPELKTHLQTHMRININTLKETAQRQTKPEMEIRRETNVHIYMDTHTHINTHTK